MFRWLRQRDAVCPAQPRRSCRRSGRLDAGFSTVELVLVIVILAVLASVATPRFFGNNEFAERSYRDDLASSLRYAQKIAVASGCPVRAAVDAAGYTLNQQAGLNGHCDPADNSYSTQVVFSDGQVAAGVTPAGVLVGPALVLHYDPLGRTDLLTDETLTVGARTLTIEAASGLVLTP